MILDTEKKKKIQVKKISSDKLQTKGRPVKQEEKTEREKKKEQGIRNRRKRYSPEEDAFSEETEGRKAAFISILHMMRGICQLRKNCRYNPRRQQSFLQVLCRIIS